MLLRELREVLSRSSIPADVYSLDGTLIDDALVLDHDGRGWVLFYLERGQRRDERRFDTEEAAVDALRSRLERAYGSR